MDEQRRKPFGVSLQFWCAVASWIALSGTYPARAATEVQPPSDPAAKAAAESKALDAQAAGGAQHAHHAAAGRAHVGVP